MWVPSKPVQVQAISEDPRRFEATRDTVLLNPKPGQALVATIDLRPSVLIRTTPEPANILLAGAGGGRSDSLIGQSPFRLPPKRLERQSLIFRAAQHADSTVTGESILAFASAGRPVTISLRRVTPMPEPNKGRRSIFRRKWFQLAMMGAGVALTATSATYRHTADTWYDRYLKSSDPEQIPKLYDQTKHYDQLASESLLAGQFLLTAGVFLLVTTDNP